jgi:hypothetical protein
MLDRILSFLRAALSDGKNPSTTRLIATAISIPVAVVPVVAWATASARAGTLVDMPLGLSGYVTSVLTLTFGLFHLNKKAEQ